MVGDTGTGRLVSRAAEMAALRSALADARAGRASTTLVAGDAGVGKSRLVAELAMEARGRDVLVLVGHCIELGEGELPYAPVAGALRALAAQLDPGGLDEVLGPARDELARLVSDLGATGAPAGPAGAFATARLFELVLGVLERAGARSPVLLVIEDLHWADGSTRDLLRFLVRALNGERLALVVTYRTDALHRAHPSRPYVAELARDPRVERIELRSFSRAEFVDHVAAIRDPLPSVTALDRLFERSEGNPFFTEELLVAADADGPDSLPRSLRDAMLAHLDGLSPATQHVLRVLAAAGRRVDYGLLAAASRLSDEQLSQALREAVAAQVLVPRAPGDYEFRHALLREAAYADLLPGERERLHVALATELEARSQRATAAATLHAELAHHWHAACELDRALHASVRAGEEAVHVHAHPEALRHFQRALKLWERVVPPAREGLDVARITASAAESARGTGEPQLAIALTGRAIELLDRTDTLRAGVLHARLAQILLEAGHGDEARRRSAQAVAMLPAEPTVERARVLEAHARLLLLGARFRDALGPIEEAIAIARTLGLPDVEAHALTTRVISLHGRSKEAVAAGQAALRAARDAGEPEILVRAHVNAAEALDQAGRLQESIDLALDGVEVARGAGAERVLGALLNGDVAHRLAKHGRFDEARARIAGALRGAPSGRGAASLYQSAAVIAAHRGDADGTVGAARLARANARDADGGHWSARPAAALAELELWRGDAARACAIVDEALAEIGDAEFLFYSAPLYSVGAWAQADRALRARALRRHAEAEQALAAVLALLERFDAQLVAAAPPEWAAHRAQMSAELGRLEDPPVAGSWEKARRMWDQLGFRFQSAVCGWRESEALLARGGEHSKAAELLGAARREAQALAAQPLLEQIEGLARRARVALAEPREVEPAAEQTDLSPRELEVLALVADGRTNREIGSELFISEKTVSVHVSRILAKLGAANRAQAATLAHRLGLATLVEARRAANTTPR